MPNVCQCFITAANVELSQLRKLSPSIREFSHGKPARRLGGGSRSRDRESFLMLSKWHRHLTTRKIKILGFKNTHGQQQSCSRLVVGGAWMIVAEVVAGSFGGKEYEHGERVLNFQ